MYWIAAMSLAEVGMHVGFATTGFDTSPDFGQKKVATAAPSLLVASIVTMVPRCVATAAMVAGSNGKPSAVVSVMMAVTIAVSVAVSRTEAMTGAEMTFDLIIPAMNM